MWPINHRKVGRYFFSPFFLPEPLLDYKLLLLVVILWPASYFLQKSSKCYLLGSTINYSWFERKSLSTKGWSKETKNMLQSSTLSNFCKVKLLLTLPEPTHGLNNARVLSKVEQNTKLWISQTIKRIIVNFSDEKGWIFSNLRSLSGYSGVALHLHFTGKDWDGKVQNQRIFADNWSNIQTIKE